MAVENNLARKVDLQKLAGGMLTALVFLALSLNLMTCWKVYRDLPLREAASRSLLAVHSGFFYDSGLSEPLAVFALKAAVFLGADPDAAVRLEGLAVFAAITVLTLVLLRRRIGPMAGQIAALFLAANPYMGYYAMQGDTHLYALFFLVLFWSYSEPAALTPRRAAWAGLYGGLACLSRLDSAWFILLSTGLFAALNFRGFNFKAAGLSLGLVFILVFPYLAYQRAQYENPFYAQELGLRRWANIDRYHYKYYGKVETGPLSLGGFIFRDGAGGALRGAFSGLGRSLSYEVPQVIYFRLIVVLVFLGFYAAFILKKDALLVFSAAAFLPVTALASIPEVPYTGGITLSYYLWALWSFCALAGLGLQEVMALLERRLAELAEGSGGAGPEAREKK